MPTQSDRTPQVKLNNKTTVTLVAIIPALIFIWGISTLFSDVDKKAEINETNINHNCERLNKIDDRFNRIDDKLDVILKEIKN